MPQNLPILLVCTALWVVLLFPDEPPIIIIFLKVLGSYPLFVKVTPNFELTTLDLLATVFWLYQ